MLTAEQKTATHSPTTGSSLGAGLNQSAQVAFLPSEPIRLLLLNQEISTLLEVMKSEINKLEWLDILTPLSC